MFFLIPVFHIFSNVFYEISNILGREKKALYFQYVLSAIFIAAEKNECFCLSRLVNKKEVYKHLSFSALKLYKALECVVCDFKHERK